MVSTKSARSTNTIEAMPTSSLESPLANFSPLFPLRSVLRVLQFFCGFPLSISDSDVTSFSFKSLHIWTCLFLPVFYLVTSTVLQSYLLGKRGDSSPLLLATAPHFVPFCAALIAVVCLYSRGGRDLSRLARTVRSYKSDCCVPECYHAIAVCSIRWVGLFYFLSIVSSVSSTVFLFKAGQESIPETNLVVICGVSFFNVVLISFPLVMATSYLITLQLLGAIKLLFSKYNGELCYFIQNQHFMWRLARQEQQLLLQPRSVHASRCSLTSPSSAEEASQESVGSVLDPLPEVSKSFLRRECHILTKGFRLFSLLELLEQCWGPFLALECALSFVGQMIGVVLIVASILRSLNPFLLVAYILAFLQWFFRLQLLFQKGHGIQSEAIKVRRNLEMIAVNNCEARSQQSQQRLAILLDKFGRPDSVNVCSCFELKRANGVKVAGMIFMAALLILGVGVSF